MVSRGRPGACLHAVLFAGTAVLAAQTVPAPPAPVEIFSERLSQDDPVVAAHPAGESFAVLGHSQDRLALRRVEAGPRLTLGPVRSVSAWPLSSGSHRWTAAIEPTRGTTLVAWTEETFEFGPGRLMAQGFSANGRRLGPAHVLADWAGYGSLRAVWVPWTGRWLVAWAYGTEVLARTVSRGARRVGPVRRMRLRNASREVSAFDLAVDEANRRLLVVAGGRPVGRGPSTPPSLMAWFLDARGRRTGREISLGRYKRPPLVRYDSHRGRFLIAWEAETRVQGVLLEGRKASRPFALHSGGFVRFPELAFARGSGDFLLTWRVPELGVEGYSGVFPAIVGRWLDGDGRAVTETEVIAVLEYTQDPRVGYTACAASSCLVAWEASRGLDGGSFLDRHAIVGSFLSPPD